MGSEATWTGVRVEKVGTTQHQHHHATASLMADAAVKELLKRLETVTARLEQVEKQLAAGTCSFLFFCFKTTLKTTSLFFVYRSYVVK